MNVLTRFEILHLSVSWMCKYFVLKFKKKDTVALLNTVHMSQSSRRCCERVTDTPISYSSYFL